VLAATPDASWSLEPGPIVLLVLAAGVYLRRWAAVRDDVPAWRPAAWLAGLACAFVALVSPVDSLGEDLFLMHMVQHVLLLDLAVVLCLLGLTRVLLRPMTRRALRVEARLGVIAHPVFAIVAYVAVMWVWHVPPLYDAALADPVLHVLEHVTFTLAGGLYWWHLLGPIRGRHRLGGLGPTVYMVVTKVLVGLLGVALAFAPGSLYAYAGDVWGLTAREDQNVGGLIMATEQSIVMGIALTVLFVRALGESDREEERRERYGPA
jgi:putative membrane protein